MKFLMILGVAILASCASRPTPQIAVETDDLDVSIDLREVTHDRVPSDYPKQYEISLKTVDERGELVVFPKMIALAGVPASAFVGSREPLGDTEDGIELKLIINDNDGDAEATACVTKYVNGFVAFRERRIVPTH